VGHGLAVGHLGAGPGVGVHLADRPLHVLPEAGAEVGISRKLGIVSRLDEARYKARGKLFVGPTAGVNPKHRRVATIFLRVARGPAEYFCPVPGQSHDVLGISYVGKGMVEEWILEAASVVGLG